MAIACDLERGTPTVIDVRGGCYPGIHVAKVTFGVASDNPDVNLGSEDGQTSDGTTGEFILFKVSKGVCVDDLKVFRNDVFSTGGSAVYSIGDSDLDGYGVNSDLLLGSGTTGTMYSCKAMSGSTGVAHGTAYVGGRLYTSDDEQDSDGYSHIVVSVSTAADLEGGWATAYLYWHGKDAVG